MTSFSLDAATWACTHAAPLLREDAGVSERSPLRWLLEELIGLGLNLGPAAYVPRKAGDPLTNLADEWAQLQARMTAAHHEHMLAANEAWAQFRSLKAWKAKERSNPNI